MLVLSRKSQQALRVDAVRIRVLSVKGGVVRLGIEAPAAVRVVREELLPQEQGDPRHGCREEPV